MGHRGPGPAGVPPGLRAAHLPLAAQRAQPSEGEEGTGAWGCRGLREAGCGPPLPGPATSAAAEALPWSWPRPSGCLCPPATSLLWAPGPGLGSVPRVGKARGCWPDASQPASSKVTCMWSPSCWVSGHAGGVAGPWCQGVHPEGPHTPSGRTGADVAGVADVEVWGGLAVASLLRG